MNAWGYMRATRDVDLVPDPSPENLARLDTLLRELDGRVDVGGKLLSAGAISTSLRTSDRTLEHLMEMKRASDRARDREDLEALETARGD